MINIERILIKLRIAVSYLAARFIVAFIPVRNDKYFCISMTGGSYGDSIKCLSDYICAHEANPRIVWAFTKDFYSRNDCEHTKVVLYTFRYYYHILTSKFILTNVTLEKKMLVKRPGQVCVQTWHGTALKRIGTDMHKGDVSLNRRVTQYNADMTDIMVSGSRFMTNIYHEKCLYPYEIIHEIGTPRNDVFFCERLDIIEKVYKYFDISADKKIILYAPTFRTDRGMAYYDVDLQKIKECFERESDDRYVVLARLHPNMMKNEKAFFSLFAAETINASLYPDMIDLLYSAAVLVTDYSSCMFDFIYSYKPIILYVPDRFIYDRGFYLDIDKLPFIVLNENSEIIDKCSEFSYIEYRNKIDSFLESIGSVESGRATPSLYELLRASK